MWGKIIGFMLGYMLTKHIAGALLGCYLGHRFDHHAAKKFAERGGFSQFFVNKASFAKQAVFFDAVFSVYGHIAKASGQVTPQEIQAASHLMDQMGLTGDRRSEAQRAFSDGKRSDFPLEQTLKSFKQSAFGQRDILRFFLEVQLQAAFADGELHAKEREILYVVARTLGFSVDEIKRLLQQLEAQMHYHRQQGSQQSGPSLDDAYQILGVSESDDDKTVKKAWRKLMSEHHPDKLAAKGLPKEMLDIANQKAQDIQVAYERIKKQRELTNK